MNAPQLVLVVRFPIPDLRSDQERGPWFKKSLQKEVLRLELEDLELKTEFSGNSSEQTKIELTFKELSGRTSKCNFNTTIYPVISFITIPIFLKFMFYLLDLLYAYGNKRIYASLKFIRQMLII